MLAHLNIVRWQRLIISKYNIVSTCVRIILLFKSLGERSGEVTCTFVDLLWRRMVFIGSSTFPTLTALLPGDIEDVLASLIHD